MAKTEYLRNKDDSNISKIIVDRDLCIGAASCVTMLTAMFKLDGENKAIVLDPNVADDQAVLQAAQSCPTQAIIILDKEGKQIYPK